ncbi:MAG: hypothetical protein HY959_05835 [Ignavibacteriae bacterium]|nr:hypothetical protein [Ignavibacteriota bacterium]
MKKLLILSFLLLLSCGAFAQKLDVKASLNNVFRYGNGKENNTISEYSKEYLENLGDARLKINDFVFGMRYEISDPIEYGNNFKGIRKRYLEYNNLSENVSIRIGDFWDIVSRGLTMNVFEDRGLAYDTGIDGVRVTYKRTFGEKNPIKTKAQILGGDITYTDFLNLKRTETYKVRDANFEISPLKNLNIGVNYVYANGSLMGNDLKTLTGLKAELPEGYMSLNYKNLNFFYSYAHKHVMTEANPLYPKNISAFGNGMYSSLSYSTSGLGVTLEYKNYRFDLVTPDQRDRTRPTKMLPFQNPPTGLKEHTSTLISRNPHVVDFNDEVGAQLDIVMAPSDKLSMNLNLGLASRHYEYQNTDITGWQYRWERINRYNSFLPSLREQLSPFWEAYFETEYYASEKFYAKVAVSRQNETIYKEEDPFTSEKVFTTTVPVELRYSLTKDYTLKIIFENQWAHNTTHATTPDYTSQFVALSLSRSPNLTLTMNTEFSSDKDDPTGKSSWYMGEVSYKVTSTQVVTASFGSEKGGLKCTNGICRYVYPFNGFRFTISSKF